MLTILNKFTKNIHSALPFLANAQQVEVIEQLAQFILSSESNGLFILKGYAGTGKTNLISALTKALPSIKSKFVLLAPTGRAAKVLSQTSEKPAYTIHKKIFKQDFLNEGGMQFFLADNTHSNTLFIVDEASMINAQSETSLNNHNLLESLFEYVFSGDNCKLIFVGDTAQLPPVGSDLSPALDMDYLRKNYHLKISWFELTEVARQKSESGILYNATKLRISLLEDTFKLPKIEPTNDVVNIIGDELEDAIHHANRTYGEENVLIITRSNKRANLFNQNIRNRIHLYEEDLCSGDKLMIVKNNYYWLKDDKQSFIANGDMAEITRITKREKLYGFNFTDCSIRLVDYENTPEIEVKIITDSLYSDSAALSNEQLKQLYDEVLFDCEDLTERWKKMAYLKQSPFFNALQVKFSYAVTCHKSQGGQWPCVFIDHGFLSDENMNLNFIRWLYTAITRASEQVYLINFNQKLMDN